MIPRWTIALLLIYLVYAGFFFLAQRWLLYPGTRLGPGPSWPGASTDVQAEAIELDTPDGVIRAWWAGASDDASPAPAAIVFHGNAELAVDLVQPFEGLADLGVSALFVEYPGFGGEPGGPTETSIMATATAAYDWLVARPDVDAAAVIAIGRSLGTGPAAGLTRERTIHALVLWSPFVSVGHLAVRKYGLPPFLALDRFDTRDALRSYDGPVLIFHGTEDRVIPFSNAQVLVETSPRARLVEWTCGHNDCPPRWPQLWEPLEDFLINAGTVAP